jgi:hypothetical protein
MDQAVQIVVSEIDTLERRTRVLGINQRAINPEVLDVNALVTERIR